MKTRLTILAVLLLTLAGCGDFEWLPEDGKKPANHQQVQTAVETSDAGRFVSSKRDQDNLFTTKTDKLIFQTYTSLRVAQDTPVTLEKHRDTVSKQLVGQFLTAAGQSTLVKTLIGAN